MAATTLSESELDKHLQNLVDWQQFALCLPGIQQSDISIIEKDKSGNTNAQKRGLYEKWLKKYPSASWSDVVRALEIVGENAIASSIRKNVLSVKTVAMAAMPVEHLEKGDEVCVPECVVDDLNRLHTDFVTLTSEI